MTIIKLKEGLKENLLPNIPTFTATDESVVHDAVVDTMRESPLCQKPKRPPDEKSITRASRNLTARSEYLNPQRHKAKKTGIHSRRRSKEYMKRKA